MLGKGGYKNRDGRQLQPLHIPVDPNPEQNAPTGPEKVVIKIITRMEGGRFAGSVPYVYIFVARDLIDALTCNR